MGRTSLLLVTVILALGAVVGDSRQPNLNNTPQQNQLTFADQEQPIKLTIATVGPMLGPPTERFKVGEQIPITITMTNKSSQTISTCLSSDLYQDLPTLTKDGQLLSYQKWKSDLLRADQKNLTCEDYDLPDNMLLRSNEPTIVDFLIIVDDSQFPTGAQSWYDPLTAGVYELSIKRRLGCCDGPMVESNKITFEVMP
jgi:hypothetical protein